MSPPTAIQGSQRGKPPGLIHLPAANRPGKPSTARSHRFGVDHPGIGPQTRFQVAAVRPEVGDLDAEKLEKLRGQAPHR